MGRGWIALAFLAVTSCSSAAEDIGRGGRARPGEPSGEREEPGLTSESAVESTDEGVETGPEPMPADTVGFTAMPPVRLVDSRDGSGAAPGTFAGSLEAGVERAIDLGLGADAARVGVAVNIAVIAPAAPGFLRAYACGTSPETSTLNYVQGEVVAALALVDASDRICVRSSARTQIVVDGVGSFVKGRGARFTAETPTRAFDSRSGAKATSFTVPIGGLPNGTEGVVAHVTVTQPDGPGFAVVHRCGAVPPTSTINFAKDETIASTALVALEGGNVCVQSSVATHVIVDVEASFGSAGTLGYVARAPARILDSRSAPIGTEFRLKVPNLPAGAKAAAVNLTVVDAGGHAYATAHPCGQARGGTSNVNVPPGKVRASLSFVPLDAAGEVCVTSSSPLHLIADLVGVLAP